MHNIENVEERKVEKKTFQALFFLILILVMILDDISLPRIVPIRSVGESLQCDGIVI